MTTQQGRQPPPSFGYWLGMVKPERRPHVLDEIAEKAVSQFQTQLDAAWDAVVGEKLPPRERLAAYRMKPQAVWDEQWAKFPMDADEDWKDYQALKAREANGGFL